MKNFKKTLFSVITLTLVFTMLTSCSKDDSNAVNANSLIGKWKHVKIETYTNGQLTDSYTDDGNASCPDYVEFKSGGTYYYFESYSNCDDNWSEDGTYSFDGNNIILDGADVYKVVTLNSTVLVVDFNDSGDVIRDYYEKIN